MKNDQFWTLWCGLMTVAFVTGALHYFATQDVMDVCQLSHSYDVCFQTLNR